MHSGDDGSESMDTAAVKTDGTAVVFFLRTVPTLDPWVVKY